MEPPYVLTVYTDLAGGGRFYGCCSQQCPPFGMELYWRTVASHVLLGSTLPRPSSNATRQRPLSLTLLPHTLLAEAYAGRR